MARKTLEPKFTKGDTVRFKRSTIYNVTWMDANGNSMSRHTIRFESYEQFEVADSVVRGRVEILTITTPYIGGLYVLSGVFGHALKKLRKA